MKKGGGDGLSAARTVLQTGEYDFAAGLVADDEPLRRIEAGGKGRVEFTHGSSTAAVFLNATDPAIEIEGERSHVKTLHPLWAGPVLRSAFGLLIDRSGVQQHVFGRQAVATGNWLNNPARYRSNKIVTEFNVDKANQLLDAASWKPGPDGVRVKNRRRLSVLFQGASDGVTEKCMAVIKSAAEKAGFAVALKITAASVFFSSDAGNPDTYGRFGADIQTYNWTSGNPDPGSMARTFVSWEVANRTNKWLGRNLVRWQRTEYDTLFNESETELDPVKRTAKFIRMNEVIAAAGHVIPILSRAGVRAMATRLRAPLSPWRFDTASLADWCRETSPARG